MLHPLGDPGLFPDAGSVDEHELALLIFHHGVRSVPGGACDIGHDHPFLPGDFVDEGGFPGIGLADDRHLDAVFIVVLCVGFGQVFQDLVQHISGAVAVLRGDGEWLSDAQIVEFIQLQGGLADGVAFVHRQHHGLTAFLEHIRNRIVVGGDAAAHVRYQHDHVCPVDGDLSLSAHLRQDHVVRVRLDTAGIHYHKFPTPPLALAVDPVTGDPRGVLHDGEPLPDELVEQGGFAHIGAPYYCNDRQCHA